MAPCCGWYWSFVKKLPIWTTLQPLAQSQVVDNVYYCSMISVSNVIRSLWLNHRSLSHLFLVSIWPRSPFAVPPAPRLPLWSKNLPDKGLCHRQGRHSFCHRPSLRQMLGIRNERTLLVLYLLSISILFAPKIKAPGGRGPRQWDPESPSCSSSPPPPSSPPPSSAEPRTWPPCHLCNCLWYCHCHQYHHVIFVIVFDIVIVINIIMASLSLSLIL